MTTSEQNNIAEKWKQCLFPTITHTIVCTGNIFQELPDDDIEIKFRTCIRIKDKNNIWWLQIIQKSYHYNKQNLKNQETRINGAITLTKQFMAEVYSQLILSTPHEIKDDHGQELLFIIDPQQIDEKDRMNPYAEIDKEIAELKADQEIELKQTQQQKINVEQHKAILEKNQESKMSELDKDIAKAFESMKESPKVYASREVRDLLSEMAFRIFNYPTHLVNDLPKREKWIAKFLLEKGLLKEKELKYNWSVSTLFNGFGTTTCVAFSGEGTYSERETEELQSIFNKYFKNLPRTENDNENAMINLCIEKTCISILKVRKLQ